MPLSLCVSTIFQLDKIKCIHPCKVSIKIIVFREIIIKKTSIDSLHFLVNEVSYNNYFIISLSQRVNS